MGFKPPLLLLAVVFVLSLLPENQESLSGFTLNFVSGAYAANKPPPPKIKKPKVKKKVPAKKPSFKKKPQKKTSSKKSLNPKKAKQQKKSKDPKKSLKPKKTVTSSSSKSSSLNPRSTLKDSFSKAHGKVTSAKNENRRLMKGERGVTYAPYKRGSQVITMKTKKSENFIRVYGGKSGREGRWVLRERDIKGLTPKQIQNKYALPSTPSHFVRVKAPKGTTISIGTAAGKKNSKFGRLKGGGIQYELRSLVKFPKSGNRLPPVFK